MIHLIYIYFIINAFLAGNERTWLKVLTYFLFGILLVIGEVIYHLIVHKNFLLLFDYYKLYITNDFNYLSSESIKYIKLYYFYDANWYNRLFIKQLDKKYNYGITRRNKVD